MAKPEPSKDTPKGGATPLMSSPRPNVTAMAELSDRERAILAFEGQWWLQPGAKEQAILDAFEMTSTRYYQVLNDLLDRPEAVAHDPILVRRLQRLRRERHHRRVG